MIFSSILYRIDQHEEQDPFEELKRERGDDICGQDDTHDT